MEEGSAYYKCSWLWSMWRWVWNKKIKGTKKPFKFKLAIIKVVLPQSSGSCSGLFAAEKSFVKVPTLWCKRLVSHLIPLIFMMLRGHNGKTACLWIQALKMSLFSGNNYIILIVGAFNAFREPGNDGLISICLCYTSLSLYDIISDDTRE